jgi:lysine biosynthesis protein LysW
VLERKLLCCCAKIILTGALPGNVGQQFKKRLLFARKGMKKMIHVECPMCDEKITVPDDIEIGDMIDCEECDRQFEVVSLRPIELEWIDEDEEGYDQFERDEEFY